MSDGWESANAPEEWDDGRAVELRFGDGTVRAGELVIDDWVEGGDGEMPVWKVDVDGERLSLWEADAYRFIGEPPVRLIG